MAKKAAAVPEPADPRVTLLNLKGTEEEKEALRQASQKTGVSTSEITRRGISMWMTKRGLVPPDGWVAE